MPRTIVAVETGQAMLRKYYWEETPLLKPKFSEAILDHTTHSLPHVQPAAYLTTNQFGSEEEAHRYLAVTYTPRFEMTFEVEPDGQRKAVLVNPKGGKDKTRIWPAFGSHGGAWELILTDGELQASQQVQRFPNGGKFDAYVGESAASDKILAGRLAQTVLEWLRRRKEEMPGLGGGPWFKVLDGVGVIIAWLGLPSAKLYSISCAYREDVDQSAVELKFWGYVWHDMEEEKTRMLSLSVPGQLNCELGLAELRESLRKGDLLVSARLEQTLSALHDQLMSIAHNFAKLASKRITLPT
jgi:hypothetical protein